MSRPIEILHVEDNLGDAKLAALALDRVESRIQSHLHQVQDDEEAMMFLKKEGRYANRVKPDLILLDLNLPKKDGREVLQDIKADADLRRIPVVVFTSSMADEDILNSYNLHANCYVSKPTDFEQMKNIMEAISVFWFSVVKFSNGLNP